MIHIRNKYNLLNLFCILSLNIFFLIPFNLIGEQNHEMLEKANKALDQKDFTTALQMYKMIEQQGYGGESMFRNMAYAAISTNADADAILYLEKALKFNPNDSKLKQHLDQIRSKNNLDDQTADQPAIISFAKKVTGFFTLQLIIFVQFGIFCLIGLLSYRNFQFDKIKQNTKWQIGGLVFLLLMTFFIGSYRHSVIYENDGIIITKENTTIYLSPDTLSPQVAKLPVGTKISYKDHISGWWQIETIYGESGWISTSNGSRI